MNRPLLFGALIGVYLFVGQVASSAPGLINYQGRLTDAATGDPITAEVDVTFTFFDAETGGTQLGSGFSDSDAVTPDEDGIYATLIGDDPGNLVPESIFAADSVWLNVAVEGEDLLPRKRITSVGFAVRASQADSATTATHAATAGDAETLDGQHAADFAGSSHGHSLQDLAGAVTDSQVPDDITVDHVVSADAATTATYAAMASEADRVKMVVRDFVVASGQSVSAGDVVAFLNGEVEGFYAAPGESVFNNAYTREISAAALSSNKFVVAYPGNDGHSDNGTAIIGEVTGVSVSWGSESVFSSGLIYRNSVVALSSEKIVVAYFSYHEAIGGAIVGEVSGNSISWGSAVVFRSGLVDYVSALGLSTDKMVVLFSDEGGHEYGTAVVGDVTGTYLTFGSESVFNAASTHLISPARLSSGKFVLTYEDGGNSRYGTAIIGEVSDTSLSWGGETVFNSALTSSISVAALSSEKFVVAFEDDGNSNYGTSIVGEVSDTTVVFGGKTVFNNAVTNHIVAIALSEDEFAVAYADDGNSDYGTVILGAVMGTSVDWSDETVVNSAGIGDVAAAALSSEKFVVAYRDNGNSDYGTVAIASGGEPLGIASAAATTGQTVPVILDGVSDVHTGLTPGEIYYVDGDGNLTTDPTENTKVGLALSDTELLLKID